LVLFVTSSVTARLRASTSSSKPFSSLLIAAPTVSVAKISGVEAYEV
jgi:hypothetical protein